MRFRVWLEELEKDNKFWERFFLGLYDLRGDEDGLSKNLAGFDVDRLQSTGEFQELDQKKQQEIVNKIQQGNGTIGDLAAIAAGNYRPFHGDLL